MHFLSFVFFFPFFHLLCSVPVRFSHAVLLAFSKYSLVFSPSSSSSATSPPSSSLPHRNPFLSLCPISGLSLLLHLLFIFLLPLPDLSLLYLFFCRYGDQWRGNKYCFHFVLGSFKDIFHGYGSGEHMRFSLDDPLDEIVDMVGMLIVGIKESGVFKEAFMVGGLGADGEDGWKQKRELLGAHGLNFDVVIHWRKIQEGARFPCENP